MIRKIGKFEVRRLLGRGAQSAVYLGWDPHLQREVAIKLLRPRAPGSAQTRPLLNEARAVSQLRHPRIVPIFEAGEYDEGIYLVFEYVPGATLAQLLRKDGALPARRAGEVMLGILEAIDHAHAAGIIHRDLKPSNILVDGDDQPRVMDFGIARRPAADSGLEADLLGTPAYMAPEYIGQRALTPQYDVYAAGLILYEMVCGVSAVQGDNAFQALHQNAHVPLIFPADTAGRIEPGLRDLIAKATAKEPELRYGSARQMKEALEALLRPPAQAATASSSGAQSTLDFLLRRMQLKSDFPAMSASIHAIQRLAASDKADVSTLSNSILKDFALTNKILRLVNSALYPVRSGERIRTVSRAIVMLGFDAVRSIAISLMLFEHIRDKKHAEALKDEFLRTNLSGILARELGQRLLPGATEETFICALFHNLGRLLTHYYFWEEAETIARLIERERCSEDQAALRVLGISYQDLGIGVARSWGFPEPIVHSMRRLPAGQLTRPHNPEERQRLVSAFANEICGMLENTEPVQRSDGLSRLMQRFGEVLPLGDAELRGVVERSLEGVGELAAALHINLRQTRLGNHVVEPAVTGAGGSASAAALPAAVSTAAALGLAEAAPALPEPEGRDAPGILAAGIQEISRALLEDLSLNDLLHIIAETIYRAIDARRVLMCMRDGRTGVMRARFGFGAEADEAVSRFQFPLGGPDLFNLVLGKDADVLIRDTSDPKIRARLPEWYLRAFDAPTFLLFPVSIRQVPVALIYADHERAGAIVVAEQELALLHTLRNQAALAIKQAR